MTDASSPRSAETNDNRRREMAGEAFQDGHQSRRTAAEIARDHISRILFFALENNLSNSTSDYAYVMSLPPFYAVKEPGATYTYPNELPKRIFVDRVGWMNGDEVARYLMMGYRVWTEEGLRLHFVGSPLGYDSLKKPFRYQKRMVCTQDMSLLPDLKVQLQAGQFDEENAIRGPKERTMPWDVTAPRPQFVGEPKDSLDNVQRAWISSRYINTRPCYWKESCLPCEPFGGRITAIAPLTPLLHKKQTTLRYGPYEEIGIDSPYLHIQYSSTKVGLIQADDGQMTSETALCHVCSNLDFIDLFEWALDDVELAFGTMEELKQRQDCSFCRLLSVLCDDGLDCLKRKEESGENEASNGDSNKYSPGWRFDKPFQVILLRNPILCRSTKPHLVLQQDYHREYMGPVVSLRTVRGDIRGEYLMEDSKFVDFQNLRAMIADCDSNHLECGLKYIETGWPTDTILLIDVEEMRIVEKAMGDVRYISLSYVWGKKPMLKSTTSTLTELKQPGALLNSGISQVTRDAITVVRGLGLRFLWIDSLCIIQDDEEHKLNNIQRMADIYGRSYLTIVALTGADCDSPLSGISVPRPRTIAVVDGMPFTYHLPGLKQTALNLVYEQRGWTFQERLISRRCLYFAKTQIFFECNHGSTSDREQIFPACDRGRYAHPFNPLKTMMTGIGELELASPEDLSSISLPQLESFCDMVSKYTNRSLSFQSDIQNAFLGVQRLISDNAGWDFVHAMPTGVFDWALLWLPRGQLERRSWLGVDSTESPSPPSWSWLGWQGQTSYSCYDYLTKPLLQNLCPRIESFTIKTNAQNFKIQRRPSAIWHKEVQCAHADGRPASILGHIFMGDNPILEFEAETATALTENPSPSFVLNGVEWLNTGTDYGMMRHGLRHNYNAKVLALAKERDRNNLDLIAMATCDIQMTFRGGQFAEDKLFEIQNAIVVMLLHWDEGRGSAERLAIGYCDRVSQWECLNPEKRLIRLR